MPYDVELLELTELVKAVSEQKIRQASAQAAIARAKKAALVRQQFRPRTTTPVKPIKLKF